MELDASLGSIEVVLDYDGRVKAIEISSQEKAVEDAVILEDTKAFAPPQDLRFAVFAAVASLRSLNHIRDDVSELRKRCLVKMIEPYIASITTANGLLATVALHYCYPSVSHRCVFFIIPSFRSECTMNPYISLLLLMLLVNVVFLPF